MIQHSTGSVTCCTAHRRNSFLKDFSIYVIEYIMFYNASQNNWHNREGFPYQISNWFCLPFNFDFLSGINGSSRVSCASVFPANYVVQAFDFLKHFFTTMLCYISLFRIICDLVFKSVPVFFIFVDWCWFYFFEIINIISILSFPFCPVLIYFWLCSILRNFPSSTQLWFLQFFQWFDAFN